MEIRNRNVDTSTSFGLTSVRWRIAQWFELRWWKNYLRGKSKGAYLAWKKTYWDNILLLVSDKVKLNPSKTICDLGCGPAGVFIALSENGVTAVDPLIDEYETQKLLFSKSDYPNVRFVKSTLEEFDPQEKYDLVFCMNCINHVQSIEKGFEKLKDICAADGTLILSVDGHNFSFFKHLFRLIPGDILHPHQHDLAEYKTLLEKQSFKILQTEMLKQEFLFQHWVLVAKK